MDPRVDSPVKLAPRAAGETGSSQGGGSNSASGLLATLIPTFILAVVFVSLFLLLRVKQKRIYQPRTYLGALQEHQKTPKPSQTKFGWISDFLHISDDYVLNHHSIDAYFYLRFFRVIVVLCLIGWPLTWAVLMPIYATSHAGQKQFDRISYSNIALPQDANRLYGVNFVAWVFLGAVMFVIGRESLHYVQVKQAFLLLPGIASRISSRTVLFTDVPKEYLSEARLRETFNAIKHVWIASDTKELEEIIEDRDKTALKLEGAEIKLSKTANDKRLKAQKKGTTPSANEGGGQWLDKKDRPTHKLKFLLFKKVDTIDWARSHLREIIPKAESTREAHIAGKGKLNSAVFIEFGNVQAAESAYHRTHTNVPKGFTPRTTGTKPQEIIWKNLNMSKSQRMIRGIVAIAIIVLMIIFWGPIIAFIGAVSNINNLNYSWLAWIQKIPPSVLGVITGLLPTILLAVAMILVPIIMSVLFKLAGAVTTAELELKVQTWYFVFQVIQVFLVTTLASGAVASGQKIANDPSQAPTLLASNLPKASNFYINYFVLYGMAVASKSLLNIVALLLYHILGKFLDKTPRKMYNRYLKLPSLSWGKVYPVFTNLAVIAITYSCISPLMLAFAAISLSLLYFAFRYNIMYTMDTLIINTQGRSFAKALQQLTTGVYLSEVCLIGLFAISTSGSSKAAGPLALMIAFLVITAIFHFLLNRTIASLEKNVSHDTEASLTPKTAEMETSYNEDGTVQGRTPHDSVNNKPTSFLVKLLRPPPLPGFDAYLGTTVPEYAPEIRREAYLSPAITSPPAILWIVHDEMGISEREKAETSQVIAISDSGAWFDEKGKIRTEWAGEDEKNRDDFATEVPIYQKPIHY